MKLVILLNFYLLFFNILKSDKKYKIKELEEKIKERGKKIKDKNKRVEIKNEIKENEIEYNEKINESEKK